MFRKFTNRQLLIVLAGLAVLYVGAISLNSGSDRSFQKNISAVDTAKVNKLIITPGGDKDPVSLQKSNDAWIVDLGNGQTATAAADGVESAVNSIMALEALQLVSRDEGKWGEFKVDTAGTRVQVMSGEESLLDIVLGRFEYKQTGPMNYVRLSGEDEVYLVNGFLEMSFNKAADDWRDKKLVKSNQSEWSNITFSYPADSSFQLFKGEDNLWRLADSTALDAAKVSSFLSTVANLRGTKFVDAPSSAYQMAIQFTGTGSALELKAFPKADGYVISSNQNPGAFFDGANIWDRVFKGLGHFMVAEGSGQ